MPTSLSRRHPLDVGQIGITMESLPPLDQGPLDLGGWFGPERAGLPLELEIGSGKGTFLVRQAGLTPGVNYIGLEYAKAYWRYAADRVRRYGLANVRVVHGEAGAFVRSYVPDAALRQVHIYFPDPWPKKRHHKRRLVQAPFLRDLHRVLVDPPPPEVPPPPEGVAMVTVPISERASAEAGGAGGQVRLATDHEDYFQWMVEHAGQVADLFEQLPFTSPDSAGEGELVGSNFERKYRREGRPFFAMILRKRRGEAATAGARVLQNTRTGWQERAEASGR